MSSSLDRKKSGGPLRADRLGGTRVRLAAQGLADGDTGIDQCIEALLAKCEEFSGGRIGKDDITLIGLERL